MLTLLLGSLSLSAAELTSFATPTPTPPQPPHKGNVVWHLFERKYTGLSNRDAGDFKGDVGFIFSTFESFRKGNPEASMQANIIEMSEVNVTGWGEYEACNAPGCTGMHVCPATNTDYCCETGGHGTPLKPAVHNRTSLPGLRASHDTLGQDFGFPGWWFSFPKESEGVTWTQKLLRRINGSCLGNAWRQEAGGCEKCGDELDSCVATCIKTALAVDGNASRLQTTWDRVFADRKLCADVPLPHDVLLLV